MKKLHKSKCSRGFTLVELLVVVAIIALLAGIAWPLYQSQTRKNHRAEAINDLGKVQVFLNRCYSDRGGYECCDNATMDAFRAANPPPVPPARRYTLTFTPTNNVGGFACKANQGYTVTAVPTAGTDQAGDTKCSAFTVDHLGNRTAVDDTGTPQTSCWAD